MMQQRQKSELKINNSYESDPSSRSGSSEHNETCDDNIVSTISGNKLEIINSGKHQHLIRRPSFGEIRNVKNTVHGTEQCLASIKSVTPPTIMPIICTMYDTIVEENSCNAVDLQLFNNLGYKINSVSKELSFDGRIKNLTEKCLNEKVACPDLTTESASNKYFNKTSPDLFCEDSDEEKDNATISEIDCNVATMTVYSKCEENVDLSAKRYLNHSTEVNCLDLTCNNCKLSQMTNKQTICFRENCSRERELLRRIRKSLAGIPPPPSLTILQLDIFETVLSNKANILNFLMPCVKTVENNCPVDNTPSIFKPTHTCEEVKNMSWNNIKDVHCHGLCLNLTSASESIEYLSLSVIERFIGSETASSYHNITTPSSAKKRHNRLKLLTKSPGNRLSHLAKRRAIFSSQNLATSQKLLGPQILIEKKRRKHRRKTTPKRKTPGSKKKSRKTPSSSARKRLSFSCDLRQQFPSRESSKRALFQSPATTNTTIQMDQKLCMKSEIANRIEKSKRALFSPENLDSTTSKLDSLLKRKRNIIDDKEDAIDLRGHNSNKLLCGNFEKLTPRALKIKSQSFCIGASSNATVVAKSPKTKNGGSSTKISMQIIPNTITTKMQRAHSDMLMPTNSLTENQRKKLLWAVSQALQERKITAKHDSFKQYASILARVVRRIFQEYYQKNSTSNSETMLRLAKKYVYNVISGKGADDVYVQAKTHIDESKQQCNTRLSGYIGPEEYKQLTTSQHSFTDIRSQRQHSVSSTFTNDSCINIFSTNVDFSQVSATIGSLSTMNNSLPTLSSPDHAHPVVEQRLPIETNAALENSSSKNNLGVLALRENVDSEQRRSEQKNFTGKNQRNLSPYSNNGNSSGVKVQSQLLIVDPAKAKRQIIFDT